MSPESPRPGEGGAYRERIPEDVSAGIAARHGLSVEEARNVVMYPIEWAERVVAGEDVGAVVREAQEVLVEYETRYGASSDWDETRIAFAQALIAGDADNLPLAAQLLTSVADIGMMFQRMGYFGAQLLREGYIDFDTMIAIGEQVQNAFTDEDNLRGISYDEAAEGFPNAPWENLRGLVARDAAWPAEMFEAERWQLVVRVGLGLHAATSGEKVDRKQAEKIKTFITERQSRRSGEAWDMPRFMAALNLYAHPDGTKMGRIFTRSMHDPEMMAMVVHALLERGRDNDAMDVMSDLPDYRLYGKMLALGDWQDRAAVDALIEDLTVVLPKTRQKYDSSLRLGVARGLYELYAGKAESDGAFAEVAEKFRTRAELLQTQLEKGYIKSKK